MTCRSKSPATADDVLHYVAGYLEAHGGISPSYQNICDALGIHSKQSVDRHLACLEGAGKLKRLKRRWRAIEILHSVSLPRTATGAPLHFVRLPQ